MDQLLDIALPKRDTGQLLSFVSTNFGFASTLLVSCHDILTLTLVDPKLSILIAAKTSMGLYPRLSVTRLLEINAFG